MLKSLPDFPWHKQQYWNNRGVFVSVHNEAHLHQPLPEVGCVPGESVDPLLSCVK